LDREEQQVREQKQLEWRNVGFARTFEVGGGQRTRVEQKRSETAKQPAVGIGNGVKCFEKKLP
jgi:hypothetical protein